MNHDANNCPCLNLTHTCRLVVVTGGPGAGKTAILEIAKKHFCKHIEILPEAASIIFGGGFWRRNTVNAQKAAQRAIFQVQRELENLVVGDGKAAIALCDRGTLDGLAYWPDTPEQFWKELHTNRKDELRHYSSVIHLRTPGPQQGYNLDNPIRIETPTEAAEIDGRIVRAWEDHPKRIFIDSATDFLEKAKKAMAVIRAELPECCRDHKISEFNET